LVWRKLPECRYVIPQQFKCLVRERHMAKMIVGIYWLGTNGEGLSFGLSGRLIHSARVRRARVGGHLPGIGGFLSGGIDVHGASFGGVAFLDRIRCRKARKAADRAPLMGIGAGHALRAIVGHGRFELLAYECSPE
jgi:hypothetical protein